MTVLELVVFSLLVLAGSAAVWVESGLRASGQARGFANVLRAAAVVVLMVFCFGAGWVRSALESLGAGLGLVVLAAVALLFGVVGRLAERRALARRLSVGGKE